MDRANQVFVRDEHSKKVMAELFGIDSKVTYDVAFCFNLNEPYLMETSHHNSKTKKVLVGVSHYVRWTKYNNDKGLDEYYNYRADCIIDLYNSKKEVKLFYTTVEDLEVVIMIQNLLKQKYNFTISVVDVKSLDDLIKELKEAGEVISPRMHAVIFTKIYNCNVYPVHISQKIKSFSEHYIGEDYSLSKIQEKIIEDLKSVIYG